MAEWSDWVQDVAGSVIKDASNSKYVQPYDVQKLKLEALGNLGVYTEGQAGIANKNAMAGISPMVLLIGAAVLAVVLLKN